MGEENMKLKPKVFTPWECGAYYPKIYEKCIE